MTHWQILMVPQVLPDSGGVKRWPLVLDEACNGRRLCFQRPRLQQQGYAFHRIPAVQFCKRWPISLVAQMAVYRAHLGTVLQRLAGRFVFEGIMIGQAAHLRVLIKLECQRCERGLRMYAKPSAHSLRLSSLKHCLPCRDMLQANVSKHFPL